MLYARLACNGADYAKCKKAYPAYTRTLTFPTILMERDLRGELLGFLGTCVEHKMIEAAPLYIKPEIGLFLRSRIAVRLFETYEKIMKEVGIKVYLFTVEKSNKHWMETLEKAIGAKPYDMDKYGNYWYRREIA